MIKQPNLSKLKGLYAITDDTLSAGNICQQVTEALAGGAAVIQYRSKIADPRRRLDELQQLLPLCRHASVPLIVNDDIELALLSAADGVHLGRDDEGVAHARERLGPTAIIGVSCYNQLERALEAEAEGADYVAFGRFFPSSTKPDASPADPSLLRQAAGILKVPTVAIGGITPENGHQLIEAGADMLAVVHAVFGQPDIRLACQVFHQLFQLSENPPS